MRLLVDARVGWGHGIGRILANTIPRIGALQPGWQLDVLVGPADVATARRFLGDAGNITVIPCPVGPFSAGEQVGLQRYARGYDLTWFTNYWVPLGWRTPFVSIVYDMLHLQPEFFPASRVKRALSRATFAKVRRDARAVMFISRFTQRAFVDMIGEPRAGSVFPLGGDHLDYGARVPVRERTRRLVVVAASKQHKNFALLLDAWQAARVPDGWTLTIVSPPDDQFRSSIDLAALARASGNVDLRRGISNAELAALYGDSAIVLMPSRYEGFGLPLLEGMLAGAWCVSSTAPAMVEIADGAFVQFVDGADRPGWTAAIEHACALVDGNEIDLDTLIAHNAAHAARFRWDAAAEAIAAVLQAAAP